VRLDWMAVQRDRDVSISSAVMCFAHEGLGQRVAESGVGALIETWSRCCPGAAPALDHADRVKDGEYYVEAGVGGDRSRLAPLFGCRRGRTGIYKYNNTEINRRD
jgi:hypothetical protein